MSESDVHDAGAAEDTFDERLRDAEDAPLPLGVMPAAGRIAMIELLARGSIWARKSPERFDGFMLHKAEILTALGNMNLSAMIDSVSRLVVLMQRRSTDDEGLTLIRTNPMTLMDTLVALILRKHYRDRESVGEQIITIDTEAIQEQLMPLLPPSNHSSLDQKKLSSTLDRLKKHCLLVSVRGEDNRFEVSPAIQTVLSVPQLTTLLRRYQELAAEGGIENE